MKLPQKTGERAGSPATSCVRSGAWSLGAGLHLFSVARSALSYQARKAAKDAPVVARMKELSAQYPHYGYRRIRIFLGRDGYRMSPGRAHRLWRGAGLQVPRKRPKKKVAAARTASAVRS